MINNAAVTVNSDEVDEVPPNLTLWGYIAAALRAGKLVTSTSALRVHADPVISCRPLAQGSRLGVLHVSISCNVLGFDYGVSFIYFYKYKYKLSRGILLHISSVNLQTLGGLELHIDTVRNEVDISLAELVLLSVRLE